MPILDAGTAALYWEEFGEGPAVLLVPGSGFSADMWGPFPQQLAKTHRVIVYDRRGFNRSAGSLASHMRDHAADAAALLTRLGAAPAAVVGWSGGGLVALSLAVEHPDVTQSLVLIEPSLHMFKHVSASLLSTMARGLYWRKIRRDPGTALDLLYRWVFSCSTGGSAYDRFPEEWRKELRENAAAINRESTQEASFYPSRASLAAIQVPITGVVGELSAYRKPTTYLARIHTGVRLHEIASASHAVHLDSPEEFLTAIKHAL